MNDDGQNQSGNEEDRYIDRGEDMEEEEEGEAFAAEDPDSIASRRHRRHGEWT